jgi:MFS family permease
VTRRELVLALYLPSLLLAFVLGMQIPTMPLYAGSFTDSIGWISFAVAAAPLGTMVADLPAGALMARFGRRRMMLLGAGLTALSCLGLAQAHTLAELAAYRVAGGVGAALWGISRLAYVADVVPLAIRGRTLSTFGGVQRIGTFVGPAAGGFIGAAFGLRAPFLVAGVLGLVALAASFAFVRETVRPVEGGPPGALGHPRRRAAASI